VLTNCDEVELTYGSVTKRVGPDYENFPHLPHPPVVFDHRHFTSDELGLWGMKWIDGSFTGYVDGAPVAHLTMVADPLPTTLQVVADSVRLKARERDTTRVVLRALDQQGQRLPFLNEVVTIALSGPAKIVGPSTIPLQGGTAGLWIETTGLTGEITLRASCPRFGDVTLTLAAV
jgi:beta-galactosidase